MSPGSSWTMGVGCAAEHVVVAAGPWTPERHRSERGVAADPAVVGRRRRRHVGAATDARPRGGRDRDRTRARTEPRARRHGRILQPGHRRCRELPRIDVPRRGTGSGCPRARDPGPWHRVCPGDRIGDRRSAPSVRPTAERRWAAARRARARTGRAVGRGRPRTVGHLDRSRERAAPCRSAGWPGVRRRRPRSTPSGSRPRYPPRERCGTPVSASLRRRRGRTSSGPTSREGPSSARPRAGAADGRRGRSPQARRGVPRCAIPSAPADTCPARCGLTRSMRAIVA